jgi:hypothetical protein
MFVIHCAMIYDIFVNCNWVDNRWQQYSTHLFTHKQYTELHNDTEYTERYICDNKNI